MVQLCDALTLDAPRKTSDGYLAVRARAARSGIYDYLASEVGAPESFKPNQTVKVYRDAAEVFAADSVRSFVGRPITNDHPSEAVTADNWKRHARGTVMGAMRDGDYLAFDLVLMDAAAIKAVEGGKRELSNGYACTLDWTPGTTPDGQHYDARQVGIRGNHVALVDAGRAGSNCAIKDGERFAVCDANPDAVSGFSMKETQVKKIVLDGLQVDLADADAVAAAISKLQDKIAAGDTALADANAKLSEATGKVAVLEKQLADAKEAGSVAALDKRVADRAALIDQAKKLVPAITADGKTGEAIRREVVEARLGDAGKALDDAAIAGAFAALQAVPTPSATDTKPTPLNPATFADSASVRDAIRAARFN